MTYIYNDDYLCLYLSCPVKPLSLLINNNKEYKQKTKKKSLLKVSVPSTSTKILGFMKIVLLYLFCDHNTERVIIYHFSILGLNDLDNSPL